MWEWLERVTVADLAPAAPTSERVASAIAATPLTDRLIGLIVDAVLSARSAAADSGLAPADLLGRADLDDVIDQIAGWRPYAARRFAHSPRARHTTGSSHVLYHGIRGYVLTENVFARRLPGASSHGQARPAGSQCGRAEARGRRRQTALRAFVQAASGDTLRDSRRYLESTLDAAALHDLVDGAWTDIARHPLATGVDYRHRRRPRVASLSRWSTRPMCPRLGPSRPWSNAG